MPSYRYQSEGWDFRPIRFDQSEMNGIGGAALGSVKNRLAGGLNVMDQPAPPLSRRYAKRKLAKGKAPVRDWNFTGETLAAMGAKVTGQGAVTIEFTGLASTKFTSLAAANVGPDQMAGLSPRDQENVHTALDREFAAKVAANNA